MNACACLCSQERVCASNPGGTDINTSPRGNSGVSTQDAKLSNFLTYIDQSIFRAIALLWAVRNPKTLTVISLNTSKTLGGGGVHIQLLHIRLTTVRCTEACSMKKMKGPCSTPSMT